MDLDLEALKNVLRVLSYSDPKKDTSKQIDKVVDPTLAQSCIDDYEILYKSSANSTILRAFTSSVSFSSPDLVTWLGEVCKPGATDTNNLRICFGIYNIRMMSAYPEISQHLNRLTVFIWPYNDNKKASYLKEDKVVRGGGEVPPYNIGSLYP